MHASTAVLEPPTAAVSARGPGTRIGQGPFSAPPQLEVEFCPREKSVHHVRVMVHSFMLLTGQDHAFAGRVTVACAELVDTLARQFFGEACRLRLRFEPAFQKARVELFGDLVPHAGLELAEAVDRANRGTPAEAYMAALAMPGTGVAHHLGLARVRYEGQMRVDVLRRGMIHTVVAETVQAP